MRRDVARLTTREEGMTRGQSVGARAAPVMMQAALATAFAAALVVRSVGRSVGRPVLGPY